MFEHRLAVYLDWALLGAIGILSAIGVAMVLSATYDSASGSVGTEFYRQLVALAIGAVALVVCLMVDYRTLADHSLLIYAGLVAVLVLTLVAGTEQAGVQRWVGIGPFSGQPSELARLVVALVLAAVYGRGNPGRRALRDWLLGGAVVALPFVLIARQPDLGTAVALLPVCLTIMVFAGLRIRVLVVVALLAVLATPLVWAYGLEDYQQRRISSFLDPEQDPRGAGTSRYRRASPSVRAGSPGADSCRARRTSTTFFRSRTMTSSFRCWPRSLDSSACRSRSDCICSSSCVRSMRRASPGTVPARTSLRASSPG